MSTLKHCLSISKHPFLTEDLKKELLAGQAENIEKGSKTPRIAAESLLGERLKALRHERSYVKATIMLHQNELQKKAKAEGKPVWKPEPIKAEEPKKPRVLGTPDTKTLQSSEFADWIATTLNTKMSEEGLDIPISWQDLFKKANYYFKGTQAQGIYTPRDAYDAMELGINRYLLNHYSWIEPNGTRKSPFKIIGELKRLVGLLPTQSKRTQEQEQFQQFSTPPFLGYVANWVANIGNNDVYLEPSAGIGGLAVFGRMSNAAQIYVNELSKRRAALLDRLNLGEVFTEDAIQLDNILPDRVKPTVIVMNPPFSSTAGRLVKNMTAFGAQHVEQALRRLEPGGRLVAIVGRGMEMNAPTFRKWWTDIKKKYNVRANIGIDGQEYRKFGTTFDNRLLIIDKTGPTVVKPLEDHVKRVGKLPELLREIRYDRQEAPQLDQKGESQPLQPPLPGTPETGEGAPSGPQPTRPESPGMEPGGKAPEAGDRGPGGTPQQPTETQPGPRGEVPGPGEPTETQPAGGPGGGNIPGAPQRGEREPERLPPESGELSLDEFDDLLDEVEAEEGLTEEKKPTTPTTMPPMGETPTEPTAKKGEKKGGKSGYEEIGDMFKEPQAEYGVAEEILEPEKYAKARPLLEKEYRRFMEGAKNFREQAKLWVKEA